MFFIFGTPRTLWNIMKNFKSSLWGEALLFQYLDLSSFVMRVKPKDLNGDKAKVHHGNNHLEFSHHTTITNIHYTISRRKESRKCKIEAFEFLTIRLFVAVRLKALP